MSTGKKILDIALQHVHKPPEPYVLGTNGKPVPKNDSNWHGPWDCAEFVSWCVYQASPIIYGCYGTNPVTADAYTGKWRDDANKLGIIIDIAKAAGTPGAAVLRAPIGDQYGHIVISDGKGGTVEAMDERHGVTTSTLANRRWDYGILVPGIQYDIALTPVKVAAPAIPIYRLTSPFMQDAKIRDIQSKLKDKGFDPKGLDGVYGPNTLDAVVKFQRSQKLVVDGEVGPQTAAALGISI
jgi:N-acetylmuramoyl-L-alanine amidase